MKAHEHFAILFDDKSYYSISSDHSPTNSFDEDGDSFTSFGSIRTPPRLRAMIRSIFDGALIHSSAGSSPYEGISDDVPAAIVAENLHPGDTFNDRRNRLLAAAPPPTRYAESLTPASDPDGEYELDSYSDSLESGEILESEPGEAFDDHCKHSPTLIAPSAPDVESIAHSSDRDAEYELDSSTPPSECLDELGYPSDVDAYFESGEVLASEPDGAFKGASDPVGLADEFVKADPSPAIVSHIDPSLLVPSNESDSDKDSVWSLASVPDDLNDPTYTPPQASKKRARSSKSRVRFSGCSSAKPPPALPRPRDAKGRFIRRAQNKQPVSEIAVGLPTPLSMGTGSSSSSNSTANQHCLTETATNTFLNTVLSFPADNYPFAFDHPNPFSTHLELVPAPAPDAGIDPLLPNPTMNLPLHDPRMQFRAAVLHLFRVLEPFLTGFSPLRGEWELIEVVSQALLSAQEWYVDTHQFYPNEAELDFSF
ncbi:hypothetical protein PGT21_050045 [Puccinia graminis f. sp. tritici]|uniref:Uncharacterized protein n=1 Tax=Puccinia graminis f. sp. tritici TaxID=56615 RepID=A0A5B0NVM0_PUCGR|nr:hypothetical protein PGT21_050045 [Puccinia graminis f. sp. tritici]KAA1115669.1 hypothetical protein PGTUg99_023453 [Puccinia graminis f. sp. tritici]